MHLRVRHVEAGPRDRHDHIRRHRGKRRPHRPQNLSANLHQLRQLGPGYLDIDRPPRLQRLFKQAALERKPQRPGHLVLHAVDQRNQPRRLHRVDRTHADKHLPVTGDVEEVGDRGEGERLLFGRAGVDIDKRPQRVFHDLPHRVELIEVVARRRQQNADDQIPVSVRQVLGLGEKQPRAGDRRPQKQHNHRDPQQNAAGDDAVDADNHIDEPAAHPIERGERHVPQTT